MKPRDSLNGRKSPRFSARVEKGKAHVTMRPIHEWIDVTWTKGRSSAPHHFRIVIVKALCDCGTFPGIHPALGAISILFVPLWWHHFFHPGEMWKIQRVVIKRSFRLILEKWRLYLRRTWWYIGTVLFSGAMIINLFLPDCLSTYVILRK